MNRQADKITTFWGKWGIYVTVICMGLGFFGGIIVTKWVAIDTHDEYLKQLLINAISEIDYNSQIAWYNNEKHIPYNLTFSFIRTDALWNVFYNCNQMYKNNEAVKNEIKECLDAMEGLNRLVLLQFSKIELVIDIPSNKEKNGEILKKTIDDLEHDELIGLHGIMYSRYDSNVKPLMVKVRTYLIDGQKEL